MTDQNAAEPPPPEKKVAKPPEPAPKTPAREKAAVEEEKPEPEQFPDFDEVWAEWMPAGHGPVRSFVESRMPEGDLIEIIITAALPA